MMKKRVKFDAGKGILGIRYTVLLTEIRENPVDMVSVYVYIYIYYIRIYVCE